MKRITGFTIDQSNLSALAQSRSFFVSGDAGAKFNLRVTTPTKFYNFVSKTFVTTESSETTLSNVTLDTGSFSGDIAFPADADGETYTIDLFALPHFDTKISDNVQEKGDVVLTRIIVQVADVVVTFQSRPTTTANFTSGTHSQTATATQSPTVSTPVTVDIDWTFENDSSDARGFGFTPVQQLRRSKLADGSLGSSISMEDRSWFTFGSATIADTKSDDGGGSSHYNYKVDSISDLTTGMTVTAVSSGSLSGTPTLTKVALQKRDTPFPNAPFVKLSSAQVFADGVTLTLKGTGVNAINKAADTIIVINEMTLTQKPLTKTVRADVDNSTNITLNGTYGISKGAYLEGFGMNNSVNNPITEVATPSSSAGTVVTTTAQVLDAGTVLNVEGSSDSYTVRGSVTINQFPISNKTIYLDLDSILTLGTQS